MLLRLRRDGWTNRLLTESFEQWAQLDRRSGSSVTHCRNCAIVCGVDCPFTIVGASSPRAPLSPFASSSRVEALRAGLRDLGWVEGKNIVIEFRWADGVQHLPELAAELVRMNVAEMRYYNGTPPDTLKLGRAWQDANILRRRPRSLPGITLIALVSETPGTRELKELSLAVNTPDGLVLVVGCSHPGIEKIVEAATAINPKIHLIAGGFHLVVAPDEAIAKMVAALKETFKVENVAPGHCTGEPTFAALKQAFGNRYIYAGVGSSLALGPSTGAHERPGEGPVFEKDELTAYRKLARREDPFGVLQARSSRSQFLHSEGE